MNGKGLLKFGSIFMAIWGVINVVLGVLLFAGFTIATELTMVVKAELVAIVAITFLGTGVVELLAAKFGFDTIKDASKANHCIILFVIVFILTVIPVILADQSTVNWVSYSASLLIPGLYLIGAYQIKKQAK